MKNKKFYCLFISAILTIGCLFPFAGCNSQGTPTDDNAVIERQLLNTYKNERIDELFAYVKAKIDENYYSESSRSLILDVLNKGVKDIGVADTIIAIDEVFSNVKTEIDAVDTISVVSGIYTLQEAYEKGMLSKKELKIISTRHNYGYDNSETLSDELQANLKTLIAWTVTNWGYADILSPEEIVLTKFYGRYGGVCVISYDYGQYPAVSVPYELEIDGVLFHFGDSRYAYRLVVYVK